MGKRKYYCSDLYSNSRELEMTKSFIVGKHLCYVYVNFNIKIVYDNISLSRAMLHYALEMIFPFTPGAHDIYLILHFFF